MFFVAMVNLVVERILKLFLELIQHSCANKSSSRRHLFICSTMKGVSLFGTKQIYPGAVVQCVRQVGKEKDLICRIQEDARNVEWS